MAQLGLNEVWREAAQRVERQAGVFFTVAAAFLMLPSVILYLTNPEIAQMSGRAVTAAEVQQAMPALALSTFVQLFGQLAIIAIGLLEPMMFLVGAAFLALWVYCFVRGGQIDRQKAAWLAAQASDIPSSASQEGDAP